MSRLYVFASAANAWVLIGLLVGAFADQLLTGEPPCPLCVMQRIGMMLAAIGPCHVLIAARRGPLEARDIAIGAGILVLGSMVGASVAIRQILLHILPGDPGFSTPILGLHLYTWAFIAFASNIVAAGLQLSALAWYRADLQPWSPLASITTAVLAVVVVANILSVIAEAGFAWGLPSDPVGYLLLQGN